MKRTEPGKVYRLGENPDQVENELREGGGIRLGKAGKEILVNQNRIDKEREELARKQAIEEQKRRDAAEKRLREAQARAREKEASEALKVERQRIAAELRLGLLETIRYVHFNVLAQQYMDILKQRARENQTQNEKKQKSEPSGSKASDLVLDAVIIDEESGSRAPQLPDKIGNESILKKLPQRDKSAGKKQF